MGSSLPRPPSQLLCRRAPLGEGSGLDLEEEDRLCPSVAVGQHSTGHVDVTSPLSLGLNTRTGAAPAHTGARRPRSPSPPSRYVEGTGWRGGGVATWPPACC